MLAGADPRFAAAVAGPIKEPEDIAESVVEAMLAERFLVLSDPIAQVWMQRKTDDPERWLRGMRRTQQELEEGTSNAG
jgi:hypothetical protein